VESLAPSRFDSGALSLSNAQLVEARRVESNFVAPFIWHRQVFNTSRGKNNKPKTKKN